MKYLQATHIKADIAARLIIQDDRLPAPYILTIRLITLSHQILTIIKFIWLFILHCQVAFLETKARIDQAIDQAINWLIQPVLIPAWIPVPAYAKVPVYSRQSRQSYYQIVRM